MKIQNYIAFFSETIAEYWHEIKLVVYGVFVFLQLDIDIVKVLSYLMITDTVLGTIKAIYVSKLKFTFKKLLWGFVSKCTILTIPMILALVSKGMGFEFKWVVVVVLKVLIVSEGISSITNILSIKEKKQIENTDYISKLLHAIRNFYTKKINEFINKFND